MTGEDNQTEDLILPATNYDLFVLISRISHFLILTRQQELGQNRISPQLLLVLQTIRTLSSQATIEEIARKVERKPHVLSKQIAKLEKAGLVTKNKLKPKSRAIRVDLTDLGFDAINNNGKSKIIDELLAFLTDEDRQKMYLELNNILNNLNKPIRPH